MAENKKSFIAYCEWLETFEDLTDSEAGQLAKHLFRYVNDLNPKAEDKLIHMSFISMKQVLKRDLVKYESYKEKQRLNGLKGGRPRKTQKTQPFISKPKKADIVNVIDIVNDTTKDSIIHIEDAYNFLKSKNPVEMEAFEMQNKKSFPDYEIFIGNFNSKVVEESLDWDTKILMARLFRLNLNWDKTPKKNKGETKSVMEIINERN